ncbi:sulfite exporter TauE/SafE family protein [Nocardioides marmotae]|uniref:sulfite exporter TauE/SafE family protein n=1 Tax=Nocardioides marmotae TaxID=2663857 RepID=UPI001320F298|nr:sulfite exporter TauE/SafE family protein [Nocardioides marmotae]MBC9734954.1 sulfite exporter TauE/SafE family protein [Nocardioides marmotae]MTB86053.1 TSUP family transporter [Nocardioides marmotae]
MDGLLEHVWVVLAGFGAGLLTSTVGVASLLSFPVLLAVGLPPVVANVSNTLGLIPAGAGGAVGYRDELKVEPALTVRVIALSAVGGLLGAGLLLALPSSVFEAVVPWLILGTCVLVAAQPRISAALRARHGPGERPVRLRLSPVATAFVVLTGVYGGYFGAGAGVMMIAVLALSLDLDFGVVAGIRTTSLMASNLVAGIVFTLVAEVDWVVVALLALSSVGGGYLGARIARRLPATALRAAVLVAGVVAAVTLLV